MGGGPHGILDNVILQDCSMEVQTPVTQLHQHWNTWKRHELSYPSNYGLVLFFYIDIFGIK